MRPILPIVMLLVACGDNLTIDDPIGGPVANPELNDVYEGDARFVPDVCQVKTWSDVVVDSRDADLSVVGTPDGVAVFAVDRQGGSLRSFALDRRTDQVGEIAGTIIRDDLKFSSTSASFVDGRLITASVSKGTVYLDMVRDDLGARVDLGFFDGDMVAEMPMVKGRSSNLATIADKGGIATVQFDSSWRPMAVQQHTTESGPLSMTAAAYYEDVMLSWSTDRTCQTRRVLGARASSRDFSCIGGRLALDPPTGTGMLVYEAEDGRLMRSDVRIGAESEISSQFVLGSNATNPRIAFDGSRYWVSYIDVHGDVVVGYVDEDGSLVSMALEGTQPGKQGYELAIVNNGVWVFAVDGAGVGAQRLCLRPVRQ